MLKFTSKKIDSGSERKMCMGIIVSDSILNQLATILTPEIGTTPATKRIIGWCLDYFKKYEKAPQLQIQSIFDVRKDEIFDQAEVDLVAEFLSGLSSEAESLEFNEQFFLDCSVEFIRKRTLELTCEKAKGLSGKELDQAESLILNYNPPTLANVDNIYCDTPEFFVGYEDIGEHSLFKMKGVLGDYIGKISRQMFISLLGVEKVGKTNFMLEMAMQAYRQQNNVLFLSVGDMMRNDLTTRYNFLLTGYDTINKVEEVKYPHLDCEHNQCGNCPRGEDTDPIMIGKGSKARKGEFADFPKHKCCKLCQKETGSDFKPVIWQEVIKNPNSLAKDRDRVLADMRKRARGKRFAMEMFTSKSMTVPKLKSLLYTYKQRLGFVPDVIVIDYADLIVADGHAIRMDFRQQVEHVWSEMRAFAQDQNCALITATQATREALRRGHVEQWDVSEDKRKTSYVTGMYSLSKNEDDLVQGVLRVGCLFSRQSERNSKQNVAVLQCIAMGKPYLDSYYIPSKSSEDKKTKKGGSEDDD